MPENMRYYYSDNAVVIHIPKVYVSLAMGMN